VPLKSRVLSGDKRRRRPAGMPIQGRIKFAARSLGTA
jgi:hypothetical protein